MSSCTWLSDRMPQVALDRAEWTTDEIQHLSTCHSCQQEWALLRAAIRLGDRAVVEVDAPSLSRALQQRLVRSSVRQRQRRAWGFAGMAAAAALAGLLWSGRADPPLPRPASSPVVAGLQIPLPELEELQPAELDSVLRDMDRPGPDIDTLQAGDSLEAGAPALETVFDYWEG